MKSLLFEVIFITKKSKKKIITSSHTRAQGERNDTRKNFIVIDSTALNDGDGSQKNYILPFSRCFHFIGTTFMYFFIKNCL